ncbi:interferon alpha/beta receptor 1 isoform X2 [Dendropsophus ebraccatus]|uniref:interferon alpha/beta receptor 1 isoform X2 n=1 Tax=Dendropsophus ebraccatus TaxID=150705 RepID=UPI0038318EE0
MAARLVTLLLPVTWMASMAAGTKDSIDITIPKSTDGFSPTWDWNDHCLLEDTNITFTAFYKKVGAPDSDPQICEKTGNCSCRIPSKSLDHSHNYTLVVNAISPKGGTSSNSKDFDPNHKPPPPPEVRITSHNALLTVKIWTQDLQYREQYNLTLRKNDSTEESSIDLRRRTYVFPPSDLLPEQTYCVKVNVYNMQTMESSAFSPEECFMAPAKGPLNNLRVDALDTEYLLKWDWDTERSPNVTFSVEKCFYDGRCTTIDDCKNITTPQCNVTRLLFRGTYILRSSVYDRLTEEKSFSVIQFSPIKDTVIGPPKELKMRIVDNELYINVSAPKGFSNTDIQSLCEWQTHMEYWISSTHNSEVMVKEAMQPFFKIDHLEASTTYCARAKMRCKDSDRSSQDSEDYCITTDPRSHLFAFIAGFTFLGIIFTSIILFFCGCCLKHYVKQTFFPASKLPLSIEKGFGESPLDSMRHPFLLHKEETMDRCYIVNNSDTEDLGQINHADSSNANSQDSGNYSNEGQTTGETNNH